MTNSWNEVVAMLIAAYSLTSAAVTGVRSQIESGIPPVIEGAAEAQRDVRAGEVVPVKWTILKREDCPGENGRVWTGVNGLHISEPMRASSLPASDAPKTYMIPTGIPEMVEPGRLELKIEGYFDCRGRDRMWFDLGPVVFEVVK